MKCYKQHIIAGSYKYIAQIQISDTLHFEERVFDSEYGIGNYSVELTTIVSQREALQEISCTEFISAKLRVLNSLRQIAGAFCSGPILDINPSLSIT